MGRGSEVREPEREREREADEGGLTFRGRGVEARAESLHAPVLLLHPDHGLRGTLLHERAQLQHRDAEAPRMVVLASLVFRVKIAAVGHVPHDVSWCPDVLLLLLGYRWMKKINTTPPGRQREGENRTGTKDLFPR